MENIQVMLVTGSYYRGSIIADRLQSLLGDEFEVFTCYRDYNAEANAPDCDVIIGDNTCKTRDNNGVSYPIFYSARKLARNYKIHYISMFWMNVATAWLVAIIIRNLTSSKNK